MESQTKDGVPLGSWVVCVFAALSHSPRDRPKAVMCHTYATRHLNASQPARVDPPCVLSSKGVTVFACGMLPPDAEPSGVTVLFKNHGNTITPKPLL